jgi:hypothetical protein
MHRVLGAAARPGGGSTLTSDAGVAESCPPAGQASTPLGSPGRSGLETHIVREIERAMQRCCVLASSVGLWSGSLGVRIKQCPYSLKMKFSCLPCRVSQPQTIRNGLAARHCTLQMPLTRRMARGSSLGANTMPCMMCASEALGES